MFAILKICYDSEDGLKKVANTSSTIPKVNARKMLLFLTKGSMGLRNTHVPYLGDGDRQRTLHLVDNVGE
jgi:hypothetical protein